MIVSTWLEKKGVSSRTLHRYFGMLGEIGIPKWGNLGIQNESNPLLNESRLVAQQV